MHTLMVEDHDITYEGHQLSPHWIYRTFDLLGDAAVGFIGPCQVNLTEMVDLEDVKASAPIYSPLMPLRRMYLELLIVRRLHAAGKYRLPAML